ncbi:hypothetical protein Tco_0018351 [Tanacetum coccineum]
MLWESSLKTNVAHAVSVGKEFTQGDSSHFSHTKQAQSQFEEPKEESKLLLPIPYGRVSKVIIYYLASYNDISIAPLVLSYAVHHTGEMILSFEISSLKAYFNLLTKEDEARQDVDLISIWQELVWKSLRKVEKKKLIPVIESAQRRKDTDQFILCYACQTPLIRQLEPLLNPPLDDDTSEKIDPMNLHKVTDQKELKPLKLRFEALVGPDPGAHERKTRWIRLWKFTCVLLWTITEHMMMIPRYSLPKEHIIDDALLKVLERHTADLIEIYLCCLAQTRWKVHKRKIDSMMMKKTDDDDEGFSWIKTRVAQQRKEDLILPFWICNPESEHSEQSSDDIPMKDEGNDSDMEDMDNATFPRLVTKLCGFLSHDSKKALRT